MLLPWSFLIDACCHWALCLFFKLQTPPLEVSPIAAGGSEAAEGTEREAKCVENGKHDAVKSEENVELVSPKPGSTASHDQSSRRSRSRTPPLFIADKSVKPANGYESLCDNGLQGDTALRPGLPKHGSDSGDLPAGSGSPQQQAGEGGAEKGILDAGDSPKRLRTAAGHDAEANGRVAEDIDVEQDVDSLSDLKKEKRKRQESNDRNARHEKSLVIGGKREKMQQRYPEDSDQSEDVTGDELSPNADLRENLRKKQRKSEERGPRIEEEDERVEYDLREKLKRKYRGENAVLVEKREGPVKERNGQHERNSLYWDDMRGRHGERGYQDDGRNKHRSFASSKGRGGEWSSRRSSENWDQERRRLPPAGESIEFLWN